MIRIMMIPHQSVVVFEFAKYSEFSSLGEMCFFVQKFFFHLRHKTTIYIIFSAVKQQSNNKYI